MDQEQNPAPVQARASEIRAQGGALWRRATAQIVRIPVTARVLLGFLLLAGILMGVHTALAGKDASLRLKVQHGFRTAQFSMWIDGDLAYSGKLIGAPARKFSLLPGSIQENSIKGDFTRNSQRTLSVNARRNDVSLNWQGSEMPVTESASASTGWFSRYAGTLLMTIAGSIVSALTGYMIRELPKQIGSRSQ